MDSIQYQQCNKSENIVGDLYSTLFMNQNQFDCILIDFLSTPYSADPPSLLVALNILVQCVKHKADSLLIMLDRDFLLSYLVDLFAD